MSRQPRIDVADLPQHIVVRGVARQPCFFRRADRALYLDILSNAAVRYGVAVHSFVLMTNHVHLLVTGRALGAVSSMMHLTGLRYVRRINESCARTGTLFEGRFRSSPVQSERYLLACMRYIELNPVRADMVERPEEYPWSSYRHNAALGPYVDWLTPHDEFLALGSTAPSRAHAWRSLIADGLGNDQIASIRRHVNGNRVLGDPLFQRKIAAKTGRVVHIVPRGRPSLSSSSKRLARAS